jgi:hypothetical protein
MARRFEKYFDKLVEIFAQIGDALPRYRIYERLFPDHERLLAALTNAYLDIIVSCIEAKEVFGKARQSQVTWAVVGKVLWKSFERSFDDQLAQFKRHQTAVEREAGLSHMLEAKQSRELTLANQAAQERSRLQARRMQLLSVLSTIDYATQHRKLRDLQHPGTGVWLLNHAAFGAWRESSASSCFALYGIPGSGKTILSAQIADALTPSYNGTEACLCFYYCDYSDAATLSLETLIGTLLRQMLSKSDIPAAIEGQITAICDNGITPPLHALLDMFRCTLQTYSSVFLVIDGIDELSREAQSALLAVINESLNMEKVMIKVYTACRSEENDIRRAFSGPRYSGIEISPSHLATDIKAFIMDQVDEHLKSGRLVVSNDSLKDEIVESLTTGARDMCVYPIVG